MYDPKKRERFTRGLLRVCTEHDECEAGETCHFIHSLISICINGQQPLTSMEAEALKDVPNEDNLDGNHGQGNAYYYQGQDNSNNPRQDQENTNPNPAPESTHPYLGPEYTNPTHLGLETAQVDQGYQNGDGNPRMVLLNEYNLHPMTSPGGAMGQEVDSEEIEEGPMTEEHIPSMYDDSFFTGVEQ
eukprot:maker-scaffold889_size84747-snap-gene-0.25 protein:Tk06038 transcript:maker-scaffold889_size84747-snap-gene-0.25-mRNA-1 annotation:"si:zfos- protein"